MDRREFLRLVASAGAITAIVPGFPEHVPPVERGERGHRVRLMGYHRVFVDPAGTTPAVCDGDPVGCWKGFCGPGTVVIFPSTAQRPTLRGDFIVFDGIDDRPA